MTPNREKMSIEFLAPKFALEDTQASSRYRSTGPTRIQQPGSRGLSDPSRPARPVYNNEQRFFIMHARILQEKSWHEIEKSFARMFEFRSVDGLTSVYYRTRRTWGLDEVLKSGLDQLERDRATVHAQASNFSPKFLAEVGYL